MDYRGNRRNFITVYSELLNDLILDEELKSKIREYSKELWQINEPTDMAIKSYNLLELTQKRYSCNRIIELLKESGHPINVEIAERLKGFNTSPGRTQYGGEVDIEVTPVQEKDVQYPNTVNYSMTKKSRGKAIIINVIPNEVLREGHRFQHIFKELLFDVELYFLWNTNQIKQKLITLSNEIKERYDNALEKDRDEVLIIMIITHGGDDKICGSDHPACSGIGINDPKYKEAILDICAIHTIVDIFAENKDLVKMFYFICCRDINEDSRNPKEMMCSTGDGKDTNTNAFVFYSCAQGYETPKGGFGAVDYTLYGRLLSESFAQYSHNEPLSVIMYRTNQALRAFIGSDEETGDFAPESKNKSNTHLLYFNPGWFDKKYK